MTVVEAEAIGKSFGRVRVLRDLTLRVEAGETVALFGPNGAGKSTLLRLCATLYEPTAGVLTLFGSRQRVAAIRRRIGLLSHQSFLYPDLSARENLVFYARLYGLARPEHAADAWLERVGLGASATRPVRVFSRGMEQRLALARTLLHGPELLLLDEPWSALDAAAADLLSDLLDGLRAEGRTILVATHDFARACALAERAVILHGGRVVWEASRPDAMASVAAVYRQVTGAVAA
ncbi:MAG: ABC transporter ATP-binding protein [Deltaproteobacteria bacterium]|nr:ABC transporter ATP-binding protein [Deltaproteobacteria bacterium]